MSYCDVEYKFKSIGKNVVIGKNVYFRYPERVEIGDNVVIDEFCYFTTTVKLGNYIHIAPHCSVIGGLKSQFTMEDFTAMAAGCRVVCSSDDFLGSGITNPTVPDGFRSDVTTGWVTIREHAVLGTGTVVHYNVEIGEGAAVGSLALVTKSLDPWGIYVGVPAKRVKNRPMHPIFEKGNSLHQLMKEGKA